MTISLIGFLRPCENRFGMRGKHAFGYATDIRARCPQASFRRRQFAGEMKHLVRVSEVEIARARIDGDAFETLGLGAVRVFARRLIGAIGSRHRPGRFAGDTRGAARLSKKLRSAEQQSTKNRCEIRHGNPPASGYADSTSKHAASTRNANRQARL